MLVILPVYDDPEVTAGGAIARAKFLQDFEQNFFVNFDRIVTVPELCRS